MRKSLNTVLDGTPKVRLSDAITSDPAQTQQQWPLKRFVNRLRQLCSRLVSHSQCRLTIAARKATVVIEPVFFPLFQVS